MVGGRLDQQRDAGAALVHRVDERRLGRTAEDPGELPGGLRAGQPRQVEPYDALDALQLGDDRAHRVAAVQLVGAEGDDEQHRGVPQVAQQEGEQVAARAAALFEEVDRGADLRIAPRGR